jgi:hypothetical protein
VSKEERSGRRECRSRPKRVTEQLLGHLLQPTRQRAAFLTEQGGLKGGRTDSARWRDAMGRDGEPGRDESKMAR